MTNPITTNIILPVSSCFHVTISTASKTNEGIK